jgi:hypothetical protein
MAWNVIKRSDGWYVASSKGQGRPHSGPYPTRRDAQRHLPPERSDKASGTSVRTTSGGLPTLGRRHR